MNEVEILDMKINWNAGWGNRPEFKVLLNRIPDNKELFYRYENGLYYAKKGAYVSFFAHNKKNPEENAGGYYGRTFELHMANRKTIIKLKGPWSSRAGCMNRQGFPACADAAITTSPRTFYDDKGCFIAGAVLMDAVDEWRLEHDDNLDWLVIQKVGRNNETTYEPRLKDN